MLHLPETGILLAPSVLHLPLYEEIVRQHGNALDLKIEPLETFIASLHTQKEEPEISLLFQCAEKLQHLSADNAWHEAAKDLQFLSELLKFLRLSRSFSLKQLPAGTKKEKDLKEALDLLSDLSLKEDEDIAIRQAGGHFDNVWILEREFPPAQLVWVDWLIENGARLAKNEEVKQRFYWSAANARKEMEVLAERILDPADPLEAGTIFAALAEEKDKAVLEQILESRKIPYSYLLEQEESNVVDLFAVLLEWMAERKEESLHRFLAITSPKAGRILSRYQEVFPEGSHLSSLEYEENPILDKDSFDELRHLEEAYRKEMAKCEEVRMLDFKDLQQAAVLVQKEIPMPEEKDLHAFSWVMEVLSDAEKWIHTPSDLLIIAGYLKNHRPRKAAKTLQGICIGSRQEISPLFENVFYIGPSAENFPGLHLEGGLFDEKYLARTDYLPLAQRLERQKTALYTGLEQAETLWCIIPQSDYTGRSISSSQELDEWMGQPAVFMRMQDPKYSSRPQFQISEKTCRNFLIKDNQFSSSTRSLKTYAGCPLQHWLRYGLKLSPLRQPENYYIGGNLLTQMLYEVFESQNRTYMLLDYEDCLAHVEKSFSFLYQVFPHRKNFLSAQAREYAFKIHTLLKPLTLAAQKEHLKLSGQPVLASASWKKEGEEVVRSIKGNLNNDDFFSAPFQISLPETPEQIAGAFSLSLKDTAASQPALNVNYRTKLPSAREVQEEDARAQLVQNLYENGWKAQNLPEEKLAEMPKKIAACPSFEKREEEWKTLADACLASLPEDSISSVHQPDTCKFCSFRSICRNAAADAGSVKGNGNV